MDLVRERAFRNEAERIKEVYSLRRYDDDPAYSEMNPAYLSRVQQLERSILYALKCFCHESKIGDLKVLDFGCGNGRWFGRWLAWGAPPRNLFGVDIREDVVSRTTKQFPDVNIVTLRSGIIPFASRTFEIVSQNLVFSSILGDEIRVSMAKEIDRVLAPGGHIFSYDFIYNNPRNRNVRAFRKKELQDCFPTYELCYAKKLSLAPPIARQITNKSWMMSEFLEKLFPIIRTHLFCVLRKVP